MSFGVYYLVFVDQLFTQKIRKGSSRWFSPELIMNAVDASRFSRINYECRRHELPLPWGRSCRNGQIKNAGMSRP